MTDVSFDRLHDVALRDAWRHEANDFTPWLAQNIDHIAETVGMPLEITGTEVLVGTFYADILARNPQDDGVVLIENQLEQTDHTHLGQIMTYLAGLEAKTVIWIAPAFREPHLSAIRWLNQHTADGFSFFALRLRLVRIGESPFAPMFEIVEQPDNWQRIVRQVAPTSEWAEYYDVKQKFWLMALERHPDLASVGFKPYRYANNYTYLLAEPEAQLSAWFGKTQSGVFVRGGRGEGPDALAAVLEPHRGALEIRLGTALGPAGRTGYFLQKGYPHGQLDEAAWPGIIDWMVTTIADYRAAFAVIAGGEPG